MADKLPGKGLLGWLGRQVGYVKKAVQADPAALAPPAKPPPGPKVAAAPPPEARTVVYREGRVEEAEHPTQPNLKLRRTVIDEVIVEPDGPTASPDDPPRSPPKGQP
jgi:hypothetical protein